MYPNDVMIHADFLKHSLFIENIPYRFDQLGTHLHMDRNEVKKVQIDGTSFVIKYYKRMTWANRIIYRFFRKSKARRAYENALYLLKKGIATPIPVAYINCYKGIFLTRSYFISVHVEAMTLSEVIDNSISENRNLIEDFAKFTYRLHALGIFHQDYHLKNILYKFESSKNQFYLIDINRMRFRKNTQRRAIKNMARIHLPFEKQSFFSKEYAIHSHADPYKVFCGIFIYKQIKTGLYNLKGRIKSVFRGHRPNA